MPAEVPVDAQWAIRWEVFAPGADGVMPPTQPKAPDPLPEDATEEQTAAFQAELAAYTQRASDYQAEVAALHENDAYWELAYSPQADEATAREQLALLQEVYATNPNARNFTLVWSNPVTWTEVA
jgi:hypothetical protein